LKTEVILSLFTFYLKQLLLNFFSSPHLVIIGLGAYGTQVSKLCSNRSCFDFKHDNQWSASE